MPITIPMICCLPVIPNCTSIRTPIMGSTNFLNIGNNSYEWDSMVLTILSIFLHIPATRNKSNTTKSTTENGNT